MSCTLLITLLLTFHSYLFHKFNLFYSFIAYEIIYNNYLKMPFKVILKYFICKILILYDLEFGAFNYLPIY